MLVTKRIWLCFYAGFLVTVLLALADPAEARMWLGVQAGANFIAPADIEQRGVATYENVRFNPTFLGGLTLGYDFVPEGFLGYHWPAWMKYFSIGLDFTYHNIDISTQQVNAVSEHGNAGTATFSGAQGMMFTITPLVIVRYGFLPDSEAPYGRLQPYLGMGIGLVVSTLESDQLGHLTETKIDGALVTESGCRYMLLRNVSLDVAFRYRLIFTQYGYRFTAPGNGHKVDLDYLGHFFSTIFRISYYF